MSRNKQGRKIARELHNVLSEYHPNAFSRYKCWLLDILEGRSVTDRNLKQLNTMSDTYIKKLDPSNI